MKKIICMVSATMCVLILTACFTDNGVGTSSFVSYQATSVPETSGDSLPTGFSNYFNYLVDFVHEPANTIVDLNNYEYSIFPILIACVEANEHTYSKWNDMDDTFYIPLEDVESMAARLYGPDYSIAKYTVPDYSFGTVSYDSTKQEFLFSLIILSYDSYYAPKDGSIHTTHNNNLMVIEVIVQEIFRIEGVVDETPLRYTFIEIEDGNETYFQLVSVEIK